jgi:hypothetical protein
MVLKTINPALKRHDALHPLADVYGGDKGPIEYPSPGAIEESDTQNDLLL